jgi:hypothetical protein
MMALEEKVDKLHNAKVIDKYRLNDDDKSRLNNLSDDDIDRLIEIADKLAPGRSSSAEISLLF